MSFPLAGILMFPDNHPEDDDENAQQEHKNGNPVYRIHIANPAAGRLVGISFPDIQVFGEFA